MNNPNIILIILDTLRGDRIQYKQEHEAALPESTFPTINSLLKHSLLFENCISNSTWTLPAHISLFSGLYESQNYQLSQNIYKLTTKVPIIPEVLKEIGYRNYCYTENPWISKQTGLTRGFDLFCEKWVSSCKHKLLQKMDTWLKGKTASHIILNYWESFKLILDRIHQYFNWKNMIFGNNRDSIQQIDTFKDKLRLNDTRKPFFLFFNIMANHAPYFSSPEILKNHNITLHDFKLIKYIFLNPLKYYIKINFDSKFLSNKVALTLKKFYDASVDYSDLVLKKIISLLTELNLFEESYIIITSDHGELLADVEDHRYWSHGVYHKVNESLVKVPLIIYHAGLQGRVIKEQVQFKDLYHTILHITGNEGKVKQFFNKDFSIISQINNNTTPPYIYGEFIKDKIDTANKINFHRDTMNKRLRSKIFGNIKFIRSNSHKYILFEDGTEELYDIVNDQNQLINIMDKESSTYKELRINLLDMIKRETLPPQLTEIITTKEKITLNSAIKNIKFKGF